MSERRSSGTVGLLANLGLICAILAPVLGVLGGYGYREGWWDLATAFGGRFTFSGFLEISIYLGALAVVLGLLGVVLALVVGARSRVWLGLACILIGGGYLYTPLTQVQTAMSVPPIHDISTDTEDAPEFIAVLDAREAWPKTANPPEYVGQEPGPGDSGKTVAELQQEAYPDIEPIRVDTSPGETFDRALDIAGEMGWEIAAADRETGRIEATATTRWFGFKDDMVIRIRPSGSGSIVDMRSKSRVGMSDVGANAARIRAFRDRLTG